MAGATKKLLSDFENFSTYIRNLNSVFQYQINSSNKATLILIISISKQVLKCILRKI